jgi:hypothetical protein
VATAVALGALLLCFGSAAAQEPDSLAVAPPDTTQQAADTLQQAADSAAVPDTAAVSSFPIYPDPASRNLGVAWRWEMSDLLATGALTLAKIIELTPFTDPVRGGFLEGPQVAVFAGRGPSSIRVNEDGYEIVPILGGALDLGTEPMAQLAGMSLINEPGGYRIYMQSYRNPRRDPYSRIEAGTGDNRANLLRGFLSSRIGRSLFGFGFDRIDTEGYGDLGESERTVVWLSLARPLFWGVWGQLEYRNSTTDRRSFPSPQRSDWVLRLRRSLGDGWHADLIAGSGRQRVDPGDTEGEEQSGSAKQIGLRGARTAENWQAHAVLRYWNGEHFPIFESEGTFEFEKGRASLFASGRFAHWEDFNSAAFYVSLGFELPLGVRALAEAEEGDRGIFGYLPRRRIGVTRWTAGAEAKLWKWKVGARTGRWRAAPSPAIGAPIDSIMQLPGGTVSVVEAWAGGPLFPLFGGRVEGVARYTTREEGSFLYWPAEGFRVEGLYRLLTMSDQLMVKLTGKLGRRGPMWVQSLDVGDGSLVRTGELFWWRVEAVVRIKDVHVFYNYEYYDSPGAIADVPGLSLPPSRYHFGVKWEFWN